MNQFPLFRNFLMTLLDIEGRSVVEVISLVQFRCDISKLLSVIKLFTIGRIYIYTFVGYVFKFTP